MDLSIALCHILKSNDFMYNNTKIQFCHNLNMFQISIRLSFI